jgi:branched-subunit amino acid transport protein
MIGAGTVLTLAVSTYTLRLAGFLLADVAIPPSWERALTFLPVAMLTSLVVSSLLARPDEGLIRLVALAGGALVGWRTGRPWGCIVGGALAYAAIRLA